MIKSDLKQFKENLPIAVVVTRTKWQEPPRMRHQVAYQLTRFFNVMYVQKLNQNNNETIEYINDRLYVYNPAVILTFSPRLIANLPIIHYLINKCFYKKINHLISQYKEIPIVLINFEFDFPEIINCSQFNMTFYVCNDEFPEMLSRYNPKDIKSKYQYTLFKHREMKVAKSADMCLAAHKPLVEKLKKWNLNTEWFPAGHEFEINTESKPLKKGPPFRTAFMGYVSDLLLTDWLKRLVQCSDMELFLIGPVEHFPQEEFTGLKNVRFIQPLFGKQLYRKLADMHVLIMPYDLQAPSVRVQTVSNKFFQYVAAGRPIVMSDMPHYISMPEGVYYKAGNADDFVGKIRRAIREDCREYVQLRKKIAEENHWDRRGDRLYEIIQQGLQKSF